MNNTPKPSHTATPNIDLSQISIGEADRGLGHKSYAILYGKVVVAKINFIPVNLGILDIELVSSIVRACNNHDALVGACKRALSRLTYGEESTTYADKLRHALKQTGEAV